MLELHQIVAVCQRLSAKLPEYRDKQVSTGHTLNITLINFYKDLIELSYHETAFTLIASHLRCLQLLVHLYDRECFRDIFANLFTPKIFLFSLLNPEGSELTFFDLHFIPMIEEAIPVAQHTELVFHAFFRILSQYTVEQHPEFV